MSLFVIEGIDGSGKSTQCRAVCEALAKRGLYFRKIVFPRYSEPSAALINMYLGGAFGGDPMAVGPYAASAFFGVDRYASFKTDWQKDLEDGIPIVCDRYTTSNAIHQGSKLGDDELFPFCDWLFDFEYGKMGLPEPDKVIYLDMPTDAAVKLIGVRGEKKDIHEADPDYLAHCRRTALRVAERYGWTVIRCAENGEPLPMERITDEILSRVMPLLNADPKAQKAILRKRIRSIRRAVAGDELKSLSEKMIASLLSREEYKRARSVFCYISVKGEPETDSLASRVLADGKRLFVPRCGESGAMDIVPVSKLSQLVPGSYGIPEPPKDIPAADISDIDLAIVPCVALSENGDRLGQGGGYYDRFLKEFTGELFCLCFEKFVFPVLPVEAHDRKISRFITEERVTELNG